jgi:hypothetical protein
MNMANDPLRRCPAFSASCAEFLARVAPEPKYGLLSMNYDKFR